MDRSGSGSGWMIGSPDRTGPERAVKVARMCSQIRRCFKVVVLRLIEYVGTGVGGWLRIAVGPGYHMALQSDRMATQGPKKENS